MFHCPFIDPVLFSLGPFDLGWFRLGPLEVRWYGLMYLAGFVLAYFVIRSELKRKNGPIPPTAADDMLFYMIMGMLIGARVGYALVYNFSSYASAPWEIFFVWHGGMSFHGGMIGMIIAGYIFARTRNAPFLGLADIGALSAPLGLMLGRLGNFINCELYGRPTTLPWGVVFADGGNLPRHPSQLYESFFEGFVLFSILWLFRTKTTRDGQLLAAFIMLYGLFRFLIEFCREPDVQLGYYLSWMTMGQILCLLMMIGGGALMFYVNKFGGLVGQGGRPALNSKI